MAFVLQITDGSETIDFVGGSNFGIQDGGFDIGTAQKTQEYAVGRPGPWFEPANVEYQTRPATIRFFVYGATRSAILSNLNKLERLLRRAEARERIGAGRRVELQYRWDGATGTTFFEVLGGQVSFATDVFSVKGMHFKVDTDFRVEAELQLDLSPFGYGLSLETAPGAAQELELSNPNVGSPQTGGILVENPFAGNHNYVEIAQSEVGGAAQPFFTKIIVNGVNATSAYTLWRQMFIGHRVSPFPTTLLYEGENFAGGTPTPNTRAEGGASGGSIAYWTTTTTAAPQYDDIFPAIYWSFTAAANAGLYYAFIKANGADYSTAAHFAVGFADYAQQGYRLLSEWVKPRSSNLEHIPVGIVRLPPDHLLNDQGTPYPSFLSLFFAMDSGQSGVETEIDFMSLLPIDDGLRVWTARPVSAVANLEGDLVDDSWQGIQYLDRNSDGLLSTPFYGMLSPIKLEPNVAQRLYFTSVGARTGAEEGARSYRVQVYAVPAYQTLAL